MSASSLLLVVVALLGCAAPSVAVDEPWSLEKYMQVHGVQSHEVFPATPLVHESELGVLLQTSESPKAGASDEDSQPEDPDEYADEDAEPKQVEDAPEESPTAAIAKQDGHDLPRPDVHGKYPTECPAASCPGNFSCPMEHGICCKLGKTCCPVGSTCITTDPPACLHRPCALSKCQPELTCPHPGVTDCCLGGAICCAANYSCSASYPIKCHLNKPEAASGHKRFHPYQKVLMNRPHAHAGERAEAHRPGEEHGRASHEEKMKALHKRLQREGLAEKHRQMELKREEEMKHNESQHVAVDYLPDLRPKFRGTCILTAKKCLPGWKSHGPVGLLLDIAHYSRNTFTVGATFSDSWQFVNPMLCCATPEATFPDKGLLVMSRACRKGHATWQGTYGVLMAANAKRTFLPGDAYNKWWTWQHPSICEAKASMLVRNWNYCVLARHCKRGWLDRGLAGLTMPLESLKKSNPFHRGSRFSKRWSWVHPRLCCNAPPSDDD